MKVLWVTNLPLSEASSLFKIPYQPFASWLENSSKLLSYQKDINLSICFPVQKAINENTNIKSTSISYYPFYLKNPTLNTNNLKIISNILSVVKPDIVHIHGTEMFHSFLFAKVCSDLNIKFVISIQGLLSFYEKHFYSGLPISVIYGSSFRNLLKSDNVFKQRKYFIKKGSIEQKTISLAKYVIGRTTWDLACSKQINPRIQYYNCNEILRESFYKEKWSLENCEKYSLFMSQGHYPIKGLHFLLEALTIVLKSFPNAKLYISGKNIIKNTKFLDRLAITYYGLYIKKLIKKHNLHNKVVFLGPLNENEIVKQFLKANIFVIPSSIENSPNSLIEAKAIGLPSIASYVGGIPDLINHKYDGFLYQHDSTYMLAYYINLIFSDENLAKSISINSRNNALKEYNSSDIIKDLVNVYFAIIKEQ